MPPSNNRATTSEDAHGDGDSDSGNGESLILSNRRSSGLAWLTVNSVSNSIYDSGDASTNNESDADNSASGLEDDAPGRLVYSSEEDVRSSQHFHQHGPSEGPVPSTISRKDISAADSIDLQMLAEKPNELALAGQDNGRRRSHRSPRRRLGTQRPSNVIQTSGANIPPPPPLDGAPGGAGLGPPPRPPNPPVYPQSSFLEQVLPRRSLQSLFMKNWSNPRVCEPYFWRDRLRVIGRRKSESSQFSLGVS
jgi:hypothetical protein